MTRISVLVTNYNYARYLGTAVESALAQSVAPHEVIVVDDGSTDDSRAVIESLATAHPRRVVPVFQENRGQGSAFNAAFAASTGDVLLFLDSDDVWFAEKTAAILPALERTGFVQHNLRQGSEPYRSFLVASEHLRYLRTFGLFDFFVPTSGLCFRREVLERLFPLPDSPLLRICADAYMTRLALHYADLETVPDVQGIYRIHESNHWYSRRHQFPTRIVEILGLANEHLQARGFPRIPLERNWFVHGLKTERTKESLDSLRAMQAEPRHALPALVMEGWLHLSMQRHEEALAAFERAVAMDNDTAASEDLRLLLSVGKGGTPPAAAGLQGRDAADAHYSMAVCHVRLGRYEQALESFAQVLRFAPGRLEIHLNRSDSFRYLGRYAEAMAEVNIVQAKAPDFPGIEETRAKVRRAITEDGHRTARPFHPIKAGNAVALNIQLQTTSRCNGKCVMCPYLDSWHKHHPGEMSDEVFEKILTELAPRELGKVCVYFENEPLMDPKIFERIARIRETLRFGSLEVSTNASLLSPEKAEILADRLEGVRHEIWISFHGVDQRSYEYIMGIDFRRSLANVQNLLRLADERDLRVIIRGSGMPVDPSLRHEAGFTEQQFREFWNARIDELGIATRPGLNFFLYHDRSGAIRRNSIRLQAYPRPDLTGFRCPRVEGWLHFLYTGELCICCMDYHREQVFGDIRTHGLDKILRSDAFTNMRDMAYGLKSSPADFICKRCISPNG